MSGLFGNSGKNDPQQINIPAFTSSGGITPQQGELGQFTLGQDLDAQGNLFGGSGTGMSTMATQGAEGAKNTEALQLAGMSDADQNAAYQLYKNQLSGFQQNLQNELAINTANQNTTNSSLDSLAQLAGFGSPAATAGDAGSFFDDAALGAEILA